MKTIKSYTKPQITIEPIIIPNNVICSSMTRSYLRYECSEFCKLWHTCRDREKGKYCADKQY